MSTSWTFCIPMYSIFVIFSGMHENTSTKITPMRSERTHENICRRRQLRPIKSPHFVRPKYSALIGQIPMAPILHRRSQEGTTLNAVKFHKIISVWLNTFILQDMFTPKFFKKFLKRKLVFGI